MWPSILPSADLSLRTQCLLAHLFALRSSSRHVSLLIGGPHSHQSLSWEGDEGLISQMKTALFFLLDLIEAEPLHKLNKEIDKLWIEGIAALEKKKMDRPLLSRLDRFVQPTAQFLYTLPPDENLYLFLLRHQQECHAFFGPAFLASFFRKAHPQGLKQTERFILQRYQKRGFDHLKATIKQLVADLAP